MSRDFFRYCVSHGQKTEENEAEIPRLLGLAVLRKKQFHKIRYLYLRKTWGSDIEKREKEWELAASRNCTWTWIDGHMDYSSDSGVSHT